MKRLRAREEEVLNFIVRDYVREASPVSSGRIFESKAIDASPATIRNVMFKLDEEGFLEKPHTSAGRAPTDRAYRYFVNYLMERWKVPRRERETINDVFGIAERHEMMFENLAHVLAGHMKLFTAVASFTGEAEVDEAMNYGLESVMKEPEFENRHLAAELAGLVDNLDNTLQKYFASTEPGETGVFIGEESPVRLARSFSSLAVRFKDRGGEECLIFSIGPKRLDYERATAIINFAIEDIKKYAR